VNVSLLPTLNLSVGYLEKMRAKRTSGPPLLVLRPEDSERLEDRQKDRGVLNIEESNGE